MEDHILKPAVFAAVLAGVIMVASAGVLFYSSQQPQRTTTLQSLTGTPTVTTLEDLAGGRFPTAYDRSGNGGVLVTIRGLTVISVGNESDGDWHVKVTDGVLPSITTEVTPAYQALLGRPSAGQVIDETGAAFCDVQHENESWHGNTCWEIHPVTAWSVSAPNSTVHGPIMTGLLNVSVGFSGHLIAAGSNQTIFVRVLEGNVPVSGINVSISVTNYGGDSGSLSCVTASEGSCSASLPSGADELLGTYGVKVQAGNTLFYCAFEIIGTLD